MALSVSTPYLSAAQLFTFVDAGLVGDCLRDGSGPRPSQAAMIDVTLNGSGYPNSPAGFRLQQIGLAASGELLAACTARGLYDAASLAALADSALSELQQVMAGLEIKRLFMRRKPGQGDLAKEWQYVADAKEAVEKLRTGVNIFGVQANADAGAGIGLARLDSDRGGRTVRAAERFFGVRGTRSCGNGNWNTWKP